MFFNNSLNPYTRTNNTHQTQTQNNSPTTPKQISLPHIIQTGPTKLPHNTMFNVQPPPVRITKSSVQEFQRTWSRRTLERTRLGSLGSWPGGLPCWGGGWATREDSSSPHGLKNGVTNNNNNDGDNGAHLTV